MQCQAYCTAFAYDLQPMYDTFHGRYKSEWFDDVLRVEIPLENRTSNVFIFSYGTFVSWNLPQEATETLIDELRVFENQPLKELELDSYTFEYGKQPSFKKDHVITPKDNVKSLLAFSHGLAQSAKLGAFELTIQRTFKETNHLPEHLAKHGTIPLSRRQIRQQRGQLFLERSSINLHLDVLDTPEFFWENPEFEALYLDMANNLDIVSRTTTLNQQLDVLHTMFEMLGSELNDAHSHRLEWAIIYLIVIEVFLLLFHDVFRLI